MKFLFVFLTIFLVFPFLVAGEEIQTYNCQFSAPITLPVGGSDWEYSKLTCSTTATTFEAGTTTDTKELITNTTTGAEFYIDKSITYGDTILFWGLTILFIGLTGNIIYNFFWRK
jgi:hypothetical protein